MTEIIANPLLNFFVLGGLGLAGYGVYQVAKSATAFVAARLGRNSDACPF